MDLYLDSLSSYDTVQNTTSLVPTVLNENMALLSGKRNSANCRLCLSEIHESNVTLLDGIIKDMLEIILPELNLSICEISSICKGCLETLKQSYNFKSSCLEIEDKVQDFVNPQKQSFVDLKEVLKNTKDMKQISGNLVVCRTCMNLGEESLYTKLCSYEGDPLQNMVEKCLPEMGLELTKEPAICPMCLEQLEEQFHFIMQCLDTEAKINFYCEKKRVFKDVDLHNVYLFSICMEDADDIEKHYGTTENLENGNCSRVQMLKIEDDTFTKSNFNLDHSSAHNIKKENTNSDFVDLTGSFFGAHIKSKIEPCEMNKSEPKFDLLNTHLFGQASIKNIEPTEEITFQIGKDQDGEDIITSKTTLISHEDDESDSDISVTKESDLLEVSKVTSARLGSRKGQQVNKQPKPKPVRKYDEDEDEKSEEEFNKKRTRTRKCKICFFKTKFSSRMKAHMTVYHMESKVAADEEDKYLKCRRCPFKTLDEEEFASHKSQHRKEKEQKCPKCGMVFVRLDFLKKHIENHGALKLNNGSTYKKRRLTDVSVAKKTQSIKQKLTSFNMARPKNMKNTFNFNGQVLKMFSCRLCPYKTRLKSNYEKHGLTHKKTSEIKTHRCKICNFETIQKENYLTHMQSHDNEGENKVMKCFLCSYQPSSETALKQHVNQAHKYRLT